MKATLWGVRGSISVCSPQVQRYGGNTSCIEVALNNGDCYILDAGTGLRPLGAALIRRSPSGGRCTICLTHGHWDHAMGLPFFPPLYNPRWEVTICGPEQMEGLPLEGLLRRLFEPASFPVSWDSLPRPPRLIPLQQNGLYEMEGLRIFTCPTNHPGGGVAYRLEADGHALFYSGDHELGTEKPRKDDPFFKTMYGADIAIVDAQYTADDYSYKSG